MNDQINKFEMIMDDFGDVMPETDPDGKWVLATDYARLEQECERLQIENEALASGLKGKHSLVGATYARVTEQRDAALKQVDELREILSAWRRMFDGGICYGSLGTLCDKTDAALSAKP